MSDSVFNLVDNPWICMLSKDGTVKKEGLRNTFLNLSNYLDIGGEIRLQDMAILRLLIAISVTILYRYDENGNKSELRDWEHALQRFHAVWALGKFNERAVNEYFSIWHDRFNLFDDKYPFFQITLDNMNWKEDEKCPDGKKPVHSNGVYMNWMPIANINGRIQRSDNKPNAPYKDIEGTAVTDMEYDEAARWLIFYNAYADCTVGKQQHYKGPSGKKQSANAGMTLPSRGSLITPVGKNLFETIMLNSVLFNPKRFELFETIRPVWEEEWIESEIINRPVPNDLPRMYTQQARRISLFRDNGKVIGAFVSAGESYSEDLLWMEPAFMMREIKDSSTKQFKNVPMQYSSSVDIWREISHIAGDKGAAITIWIEILLQNYDDDKVIPFRVTGIKYGKVNCGIQSMTEDRIVLSRQFLMDTDTQVDAVNEIKRIDSISKLVFNFGNNCARCMNLASKDIRVGGHLSDQFYDRIGYEFRKYLSGLSSITDIRKSEFEIAREVTAQFVEHNIKALLKGKSGEKSMYLGKAEAIFNAGILKIERK